MKIFKIIEQNEELAGYTKHARNQWAYSQKAIELVIAFWQKFPKLFAVLSQRIDHNELLFESEICDGAQGDSESDQFRLADITNWLKEQPHQKASRRCYGTDSLEKNTIAEIISAIEIFKVNQRNFS